MSENSRASFWKQEGMAILLLTVTAHAAYLAREMGYADFFSVPHDLIALSPVGLAAAAQAIFLGLLAYVMKVNLIWILTPKGKSYLAYLVRFYVALALIGSFALYPYASANPKLWFFLLALLLPLFGQFVWPLLTQKNVSGYENKVVAQTQLEFSIETAGDVLTKQIGRQGAITFFIVVAMLVFAYGEGRLNAMSQEDFFLSDGRQNVALLRFYGDTGVYVNFDEKSLRLSGEIVLKKLDASTSTSIKKVHLGKMKSASL